MCGGERKTLRLVAQYADACNLFARLGHDELRRKLDILRAHCEAVRRPYAQIEKTTLEHTRITRDGRDGSLTPDVAIERFAAFAALGVDQAIISLQNVTDLEPFELLATHIVPAVERMAVAEQSRPPEGVSWADWERVLAARSAEATRPVEALRHLGPEVEADQVLLTMDEVLTRKADGGRFLELRTARVSRLPVLVTSVVSVRPFSGSCSLRCNSRLARSAGCC